MPSIRTITAVLVPLAAYLTTIHAATPAEVEVGKIPGFTGGEFSSHAGDHLISTYCFCTQPTPTPQQPSEAHYFQFEYYNFHQNTTYILDHLCRLDQDSPSTCLIPRLGAPDSIHWVAHLCRSWDSDRRDELCFEPHGDNDLWRQWRVPGPDLIGFNGQKRSLGPMGGQGPRLEGREVAEGVCESLCRDRTGMAALRGNDLAQCHVVTYEDMDDMCDGCK